MTAKGRFVWYDLMTEDVEASKTFYTETIGWKTKEWDGPKPYTMLCVQDQPVAGIMQLPDEAKAQGAKPHWIGYVAVEDVAATAKRASELGGAIFRDATDIPNVGRFAVLGDPQGVAIAVFDSSQDRPLYNGPPRSGDMTWHELNTTDHVAAWPFYSQLFDWNVTEEMDMGPDVGVYKMYQRTGAEGSMGGMCSAVKDGSMPPHWLYYTSVDDIDATIERVKSRGGSVVHGPMEVPGGDRVAQCLDPQGITFALHSTTSS